MNYLLKSKPNNSNRNKIIFIIVLFLFLSLIIYLFPNALRRLSGALAKPVWYVGGLVLKPFPFVKDYFVTKNTLISQNLALQEQVTSLQNKATDYDVISKENEDLKALMGRTSKTSRIVSTILSRPPTSPYDTLIIDVGSSEGVLPGSKIYLSDTIIVGFVTNVTPDTSTVSLFSTPGKKQEAKLLRTGASFVITGSGGQNFKLEVPKDTDILWGDSFMYPGLSSSLLANVYYIDTNSQSSFKTIYLRIPENVFSSKYLFVE